LEKTQIEDCSVDVVISNCVINLCPAISDIILTEKIDPELRGRFQATWAGCMGGSITEEDYLQIINKAGFTEIQIIEHHRLTSEVLAAMACCPSEELTPSPNKEDLALVQGKVASIKFTAIKPSTI